MVWQAALALLAAAPDASSARETLWEWTEASGSTFTVYTDDVKRQDDYGQVFSAWVHGDHSRAKSVAYRRSLFYIRLNCSGSYEITAWTTYAADGRVMSEWDGAGKLTQTRPGSAYDELTRRACQRRK